VADVEIAGGRRRNAAAIVGLRRGWSDSCHGATSVPRGVKDGMAAWSRGGRGWQGLCFPRSQKRDLGHPFRCWICILSGGGVAVFEFFAAAAGAGVVAAGVGGCAKDSSDATVDAPAAEAMYLRTVRRDSMRLSGRVVVAAGSLRSSAQNGLRRRQAILCDGRGEVLLCCCA
jgi:hypothetical protein